MFKWLKKNKASSMQPAVASEVPPPSPDTASQVRARAETLLKEGNGMLDADRPEEAARFYRLAVEADPSHPAAHLNLGFVLLELGRHEEAGASLRRAVALDAWLHDAHYMLGRLALGQGQASDAESSWRQALMVHAEFPECRRDLCMLLAQQGRAVEAREVLAGGRAFPEGSPEAHFFRGMLAMAQNQYAEAAAEFAGAAAFDPANPGALTHLGLAQFKHGDVFSAIDSFRRCVELLPTDMQAHCNLGGAYQISGRLDLAAQSYERAIALDASYFPAYHNRLYALSFDQACTPENYLEQARLAGLRMRGRARPFDRWLVDPGSAGAPRRPLRVGMVSGDLRSHPVGAFLEGVVGAIDRDCLALVAYSTQAREDALTARLKPHFVEWNMVESLDDAALAARIHADRIDILVDLAGHTAYTRLPVFAWRPAPVQVAWLGFFATTGVEEIDYILVDPLSVPEPARAYLAETPWYLPDTRLCFTAPVTAKAVPVVEPPMVRQGHVTFGSFQLYSKLSDSALAVWARVLQTLPSARLRLQSWQLGFPRAQEDIRGRLGARGIDASRIDLHGGAPREEYLAAHGEVDIILDTFPFPGGTTTAEALWMGVPTVSRSGRTLLERQGESLLACAGLSDWVARDDDEFVRLAVAKAGDVQALRLLRGRLREQVLASPLFDANRFARHLEEAFEGMWRAGRPAR